MKLVGKNSFYILFGINQKTEQMKTLITIMIILFAAGCGKSESLTDEKKLQFDKELKVFNERESRRTAEEMKVVGSYEAKADEITLKLVFLENRGMVFYVDEKKDFGTWKIAGKEVHGLGEVNDSIGVFKIEPNGDLTAIARIKDGKREEGPKEVRTTFKKIK